MFLGQYKTLYIRSEQNSYEIRCPLIPSDIAKLLTIFPTFVIYLETSDHRIFVDEEYIAAGARLTNLSWYDPTFRDALIVGLKELPHIDQLRGHNHLYFSHSFQGQSGSDTILKTFDQTASALYDLEYLVDNAGNRLITFGEWAGRAGAGLGLLQYYSKTILGRDMDPIEGVGHITRFDFDAMIARCVLSQCFADCRIAVMGANGRSGLAVCQFLGEFGIPFVKVLREDAKHDLLDYDLIYNCILLGDQDVGTWITQSDLAQVMMTANSSAKVLVDISCDVSKRNHPFRELYTEPTTWHNPVKTIDCLSCIVLSNLPTLLAKDACIDFSSKLVGLFMDQDDAPFQRALSSFRNVVAMPSKTAGLDPDPTLPAIYVVNYCDEERRERMSARFQQIGLSAHFSDPVHAKDVRLYVEGQDMTGRTASIMLQHMDCLAHFLDNTTTEYCIVCEDDIMISKNLAKELPEIIKAFEHLSLDVLLLGYLWPYDICSDWNAHFPHIGESRGSEGQRYEYTGFPDDLWGSQMYMLSRKHALVLVKQYGPDYMVRELPDGENREPYNPDWILTKKGGRRAIIIPMLAVEEGDSKLGGDAEHTFHWACRMKNYVEGLHI